MKSKRTVFILLLVSGLFFVITLFSLDLKTLKNGTDIVQICLPLSFLLSASIFLENYIKMVKKD
jgi:hypothetical protein